MDRGTSSYAPLTRRRVPRRLHLFKTARLNAVGWLALFAVCAVVAGAFAGIAVLLALPWWLGALVGGLAALGSLIALDRRKFNGLYATYSWTDDEQEKAEVCSELRAAGIDAELMSWNNEPPFGVRVLNRDSKRANRILVARGIRPGFRF
jgi:hypothetical protein